MTFSESLRRFRREHDLTQKAVADAIGTKVSVYQRYERGTATPSVAIVAKIADIFDVPMDYLVGRDEVKSQPESHLLNIYRNLDEDNRRTLTDMANFLNMKQGFKTVAV